MNIIAKNRKKKKKNKICMNFNIFFNMYFMFSEVKNL